VKPVFVTTLWSVGVHDTTAEGASTERRCAPLGRKTTRRAPKTLTLLPQMRLPRATPRRGNPRKRIRCTRGAPRSRPSASGAGELGRSSRLAARSWSEIVCHGDLPQGGCQTPVRDEASCCTAQCGLPIRNDMRCRNGILWRASPSVSTDCKTRPSVASEPYAHAVRNVSFPDASRKGCSCHRPE
jgi:hypothetical protein